MLSLFLAAAVTVVISYALALATFDHQMGGPSLIIIRALQCYIGGFIAGIGYPGRTRRFILTLFTGLVIITSSLSYYYFHYREFRASMIADLNKITQDETISEFIFEDTLLSKTGKPSLLAYIELRLENTIDEISFEYLEDEPETTITVPRASFEIISILLQFVAIYYGMSAGLLENLTAKKQYRRRRLIAFFYNPFLAGLLGVFSSDFRDLQKMNATNAEQSTEKKITHYMAHNQVFFHPVLSYNANLFEWDNLEAQIDLAQFGYNSFARNVEILSAGIFMIPLPLNEVKQKETFSNVQYKQSGSIIKLCIPSIPVGNNATIGLRFRVLPTTPLGTIFKAVTVCQNPDLIYTITYYVTDLENSSKKES